MGWWNDYGPGSYSPEWSGSAFRSHSSDDDDSDDEYYRERSVKKEWRRDAKDLAAEGDTPWNPETILKVRTKYPRRNSYTND